MCRGHRLSLGVCISILILFFQCSSTDWFLGRRSARQRIGCQLLGPLSVIGRNDGCAPRVAPVRIAQNVFQAGSLRLCIPRDKNAQCLYPRVFFYILCIHHRLIRYFAYSILSKVLFLLLGRFYLDFTVTQSMCYMPFIHFAFQFR